MLSPRKKVNSSLRRKDKSLDSDCGFMFLLILLFFVKVIFVLSGHVPYKLVLLEVNCRLGLIFECICFFWCGILSIAFSHKFLLSFLHILSFRPSVIFCIKGVYNDWTWVFLCCILVMTVLSERNSNYCLNVAFLYF